MYENPGSSVVPHQVENKTVCINHIHYQRVHFDVCFLLLAFYMDLIDHAVCRPLEPVYRVVMDMQLVIRSEACDIVPSIVLRPLKSL